MNLIITSEMRVGSRWVHYLLGDILKQHPGPEVDGKRLYSPELPNVINWVKLCFEQGIIPKFHGIGVIPLTRILDGFGIRDFFIVGVVRNPFDRAVSLAFHNRYPHNDFEHEQKKLATDEEAVSWTVTEDTGFLKSCVRQYSDLMLPYYSTHSLFNVRRNDVFPYVWTTYKWLKKDIAEEIQEILYRALMPAIPPRKTHIQEFVDRHSFKTVTGRGEGTEERDNQWYRKGIEGDHENWFGEECFETLNPYQYRYNYMIALEESGKMDGIPVI